MQECERSGRWWGVVMVFTGCLLTSAGGAAQPSPGSLRLVVEPERTWVVVGNTLNVSIGLRDAHDQPSAAPGVFVVALAMIPPVEGATPTVTIPAGQSAATLQLQPAKPGILEIRATHPQVFDGGAFVRVVLHASPTTPVRPHDSPSSPKPKTRHMGDQIPTAEPLAIRGGSPAPAPTPVEDAGPTPRPHSPKPKTGRMGAPAADAGAAGAGAPGPAPVDEAGPARQPIAPPTDTPRGEPGPPTPTASDGDPASAPRLELRYSPQRKLLADGQDAATIQAFLVGDDVEPAGATDGSLKVNLFASSGTLAPLPLVVQGFEGGRSTLTADRPGDVEVEFVGSQPYAKLAGEQRLHIHFGAPIHGLRFEAKPASISLVDDTDLVVTLLDASGRAVATDESREVSLALDTGHGEIIHKDLIVKSGDFDARTRFVATGVGQVVVSAASAPLLNQTARLDVRLPLGILMLSVMGGLVGGLLAYLRHRGTRWTRVAIGGVTGFLLYWAFIFGLMRVMPRAIVLNPLSNFALSTIGGWLGTEVFTLLLKWLGLKQPDTGEAGGGDKHGIEPDRG